VSADNVSSRRYAAFISYNRQHDSPLAASLQNALETFAKPWQRSRGVRIFRDTTSLPPAKSLSDVLERALDDADFLILIASPESAASPWVELEVNYWLRTREVSSIIVVAAAGEAIWLPSGQPGSTLPPSLAQAYQADPNYVDLRAPEINIAPTLQNPLFLDAVATILSALRSVPKDELVGEHLRQHRAVTRLRRVAIVLPTILTIAAVLLAVAAKNEAANANHEKSQADRQRNTAASRALAADSEIKSATDPELSMLLALAATDVSPTAEARSALLRQAVARERIERVLAAPGGQANAVAAGGGLFAVAAGEGVVDIWNMKDFGIARALRTGDRDVFTLAFSPDGRTLAVGGSVPETEGGSLVLWNPRTGQPISPNLVRHMPPPAELSYGDGGRMLAVQYFDSSAVEILTGEGRFLTKVPFSTSFAGPFCGDLNIDANGSHLIESNRGDESAAWWNLNRGTPSYGGKFAIPASARRAPATGPGRSSRLLEPVVTGHRITVFDIEDRRAVASIQAGGPVTCVALSADARYLAYGRDSGTVGIYDITTGHSMSLKFHTGRVTGIAFLSDFRLITTDNTGVVVVWNIGPSTVFAQPLTGITNAVSGSYLPRSDTIVTAGKEITRWHFGDKSSVTASPSPHRISSLAVVPDGRLAVDDSLNVFLQKTVAGPFVKLSNGDVIGIGPVAASPDGTLLASGGSQQTILRWNAVTLSLAGETKGAVGGDQDDVSSLAFSQDGRILATGDSEGSPSLWNPRTGHFMMKLATPQLPGIPHFRISLFSIGFVQQVAISMHDRMLAASDPANGVVIWDIATRSVRGVLAGGASQVTAMAFDPTGDLLATGDHVGNVTLWDMARLAPLGTWSTGKKEITSLAFRADGRRLLSVGGGTATQWNTDPAEWYRQVCDAAARPLSKSERLLYAPDLPKMPACQP
jgi:WD40 repeat protein